MVEPLRVKKICPKCFAMDGVSIVLEKYGDEYICPRCGTRYIEDENGMLKRV